MRRKFLIMLCVCAMMSAPLQLCGCGAAEGVKIRAGWPVLQVVKAARGFGELINGKKSVLPEAVSDIAEDVGGKRGKIIIELIARFAAIVRYRPF